jgi:hypothetical protein
MSRARLFDEDARQAMYGADEGFSRRRSPPAALEGQGAPVRVFSGCGATPKFTR